MTESKVVLWKKCSTEKLKRITGDADVAALFHATRPLPEQGDLDAPFSVRNPTLAPLGALSEESRLSLFFQYFIEGWFNWNR